MWDAGTKEVGVIGDLEVNQEQEGGLIGMVLDPGFAENGWLYLNYSVVDKLVDRVSRFAVKDGVLELASESVVIEIPVHRDECCHHAGSMEFGVDGSLFIATGDNTHPGGDSRGYAPIDEREGRMVYDAQKSSANTADLRGKVLRVMPKVEGGYEVPEGNLFPGGEGGRAEIYVMGCRNPWRISIDAETGYLYWGDVGPDAGADGERGPRGHDELNQARAAGNFGWPYFVGDNQAYADVDFATGKVGKKYDAKAPVNESPLNTGAKVLPAAQPAWIYYPYAGSEKFPALGGGGRTACAGPVFHYEERFEETGGFPEEFDRCLLWWDWQRPFVKWARLGEGSQLEGLEVFDVGMAFKRMVDADFDAGGVLYLLEYGETWGVNQDAKLVRVSYER
ncbi:MAG: PQQ-dependent sugar dehydrogenase [Verrucomicrobiales bacterium]|nr:PQQ-dependent sugar dehydrogenase [Verrucomicrobiales bacterium]